MSDTDAGGTAQPMRREERLNLSESDSNHSSQRPAYETFKRDKALKVIWPVEYCYKEALYFRANCLENTLSCYDYQVAQNPEKWAKNL